MLKGLTKQWWFGTVLVVLASGVIAAAIRGSERTVENETEVVEEGTRNLGT